MTLALDAATLARARTDGRALVGFSIYNLEQGLGVVAAAEGERVPVLLQAGASAFAYAGREPLAAVALALAHTADTDVGVHLDHCTDLGQLRRCLELGYTSVMFDGSALPYAENVRLTRAAVAEAHAVGAWVEAELAGFAGDEDQSIDVAAQRLTDPDIAADFVAETEVDALAVAVGNVHGIPAGWVELDLERLAAIADSVSAPLVLHGASGLPRPQLHAAIELGVAKLNVNTELRRAWRDALLRVAADPPGGDHLPSLMTPALEAVRDAAGEILRAFTDPQLQSDVGSTRSKK